MTNKVIIVNQNVEEDIKLIKSLEAKIDELTELKKAKEDSLKSILDEAGVEELEVGIFTIRFQNITRNNFNTSEFKKKYLELYKAFLKTSNYRKFLIN